MEEQDQTVVQQLVDRNPRFRMLYEEHLLLEKELNHFEQRSFLSAEEELVKKKIQKMKLVGKDEMFRMIKNYRRQ